ncbi:MAG TPA: acylphosphatase [Acidimicrobiales bacterium]|nr:acylphosphatase [Acidimicrobiales bacterium]
MPDAPPTVRRIILVSGLVQGVYFRESCRVEAGRLGVSGTVENLTDGRLRGDFEGPEPAVEALVAWCGHGPARARVEGLAASDATPQGASDFCILH